MYSKRITCQRRGIGFWFRVIACGLVSLHDFSAYNDVGRSVADRVTWFGRRGFEKIRAQQELRGPVMTGGLVGRRERSPSGVTFGVPFHAKAARRSTAGRVLPRRADFPGGCSL